MNDMQKPKKRFTARWIAITACLLAANAAASSFSIPVPGGHFYLCDVVICTAALLLDPVAAFFVGGVGSFLGDFLFYPTPMFVSLVTHGLQAVVISLCARHLFKKRPVLGGLCGVVLGSLIMVAGYTIGRAFIYATPEYALIKLPFEFLQAGIGAVAGMLLCYRFPLRTVLQKFLGKQ